MAGHGDIPIGCMFGILVHVVWGYCETDLLKSIVKWSYHQYMLSASDVQFILLTTSEIGAEHRAYQGYRTHSVVRFFTSIVSQDHGAVGTESVGTS